MIRWSGLLDVVVFKEGTLEVNEGGIKFVASITKQYCYFRSNTISEISTTQKQQHKVLKFANNCKKYFYKTITI